MITMMVGIAGSGKSTWAKTFRPEAVIVSTDTIRERLWGDASIQNDPQKVFSIAFKEIQDAVKVGRDVVFDATNLTKKDRRKALRSFKAGVEVEAVFLDTPLACALERNAGRSRIVPEDVLVRMSAKLEPPTLEEGFSKIITITLDNNEIVV